MEWVPKQLDFRVQIYQQIGKTSYRLRIID